MLSSWSIMLIIVSTVAGAVGSLFFKKAAADFSLDLISQLKNFNLFLGMATMSTGTIIYLFVLATGALSVIYSLTALTYIWIEVLSVKVLGERMNRDKWIGLGLIIIGIALIAAFH